MHARDAKLALIRDAVSPFAVGDVLDNTSTTLSAIKAGALSIFPRIVVVPGRESPKNRAHGTGAAPTQVRRTLPIHVTVFAESRAKLSDVMVAVEAAIPWNDADDVFELGDTIHDDHDVNNRVVYVATLTVTTDYTTGLGQAGA